MIGWILDLGVGEGEVAAKLGDCSVAPSENQKEQSVKSQEYVVRFLPSFTGLVFELSRCCRVWMRAEFATVLVPGSPGNSSGEREAVTQRSSSSVPEILALHHSFDLNSHRNSICHQLAGLGFRHANAKAERHVDREHVVHPI